jgi:LPS export ABC transporter protein LptC
MLIRNLKTASLNGAIFLAACLSIWLLISNHVKQGLNPVKLSQQPDAYAEQVKLTRMDESGQLNDQIYSAKLTYYAATQTSLLTMPKVLMFVTGKAPWHMQADYAQAQHKSKTIQLWGNVKLDQTALDRQQTTLSISTSALTLFPQQREIKTQQTVTLVQPNSFIQAIGLYADIKQGIVQLLNKTQGRYAPIS